MRVPLAAITGLIVLLPMLVASASSQDEPENGPDRSAEPYLRELLARYAALDSAYFRIVRYEQSNESVGRTVDGWLDLWMKDDEFRLDWNTWLGSGLLLVVSSEGYMEDRLNPSVPILIKERQMSLQETDASLRWRSNGTPLLEILESDNAIEALSDENGDITYLRRPGVDRTLRLDAPGPEEIVIEVDTSGEVDRIQAVELRRWNGDRVVSTQRDVIVESRYDVRPKNSYFAINPSPGLPVEDQRPGNGSL